VTPSEFYDELNSFRLSNPQLRHGQAAVVLMHKLQPENFENEFDCFYNDELTTEYVEKCLRKE
jgi:hypothetical protein